MTSTTFPENTSSSGDFSTSDPVTCDPAPSAPAGADQQQGLCRLELTVQGQVQGVGFRPFVFRLAHDLQLTGQVGNTSEGVHIEVQGTQARLFPALLREKLPPLARLTHMDVAEADLVADETEFRIVESQGHHGHNVLISPDVGICADCLADMQDPANSRYRYPFTNCTNCGPRYTITHSIPYDRAVTSMACFPMCPDCAREYRDPLDRRFHAQPVACPVCGPELWFVANSDLAGGLDTAPPSFKTAHGTQSAAALTRCVEALLAGEIVALRGLGGFQLACDARNGASVARLRERKTRPSKSFALMVQDTDAARELCHVSQSEEQLLTSPARPAVVLLRKNWPCPEAADADKENAGLALVAPDIPTFAIMLPTTPLHVVLFMELEEVCRAQGRPRPVLVMTSGNASGDPICLGNREALARLAGSADAFLLHNRDILCRVDDSVVLAEDLTGSDTNGASPFFLRRARGYVPSPVVLAKAHDRCAFGAGTDLKATCCITRGQHAFVGQHIGDLDKVATSAFYDEVASHLLKLLEVRPDVVVADLHPDFHSRGYAEELAGRLDVPLITLQHHAAHAAAVLAEHGIQDPSLALVLDGFGLGEDKTVWGGELLAMDLGSASWQRLGHLATFGLPGGDAATKAPWRIALGLGLACDANQALARWHRERGREADIVAQMCTRKLQVATTSSCGRLFDALAAELGLCQEITYEGQAAIRLETLAWQALSSRAARPSPEDICTQAASLVASLPRAPSLLLAPEQGLVQVDSLGLFARAGELAALGVAPARIALDFHWQLADALTSLVQQAARTTATSGHVALAGGVFNNTLLRTLLVLHLRKAGLVPLLPRLLPPGDGGLSLGQAAWGLALTEHNAG